MTDIDETWRIGEEMEQAVIDWSEERNPMDPDGTLDGPNPVGGPSVVDSGGASGQEETLPTDSASDGGSSW